MELSNEDLLEFMEKLTKIQVEATVAFTTELTKIAADLGRISADILSVEEYFKNGFKEDIITSFNDRYDKMNQRMTHLLVVNCGLVVILIGVLGRALNIY